MRWPSCGAVIAAGERLGTVIPGERLKVLAGFPPAQALGRVRPGQTAELRLDAFPWTEYGGARVRVARVGGELRDGRVWVPEGPRLLAVLRCRAGRLRIVAPEGRLHPLRAGELVRELQAPLAATAGPAVDQLLDRAGVTGRRRAAARGTLLGERLRQVRVGGCWMLRLPPGASFLAQMRREGLLIHLLQFLLGYAVGFALLLLSWWPLGAAVLQGGSWSRPLSVPGRCCCSRQSPLRC